MMLSLIIKKLIVSWTRSGVINESDQDIYNYGLELMLFSFANVLTVIITALLLNRITETIMLLVVIVPMQSFGGGYHADTHLRCFLTTYIMWWCFISIIPIVTSLCATVVICISITAVFYFAPVANENVQMSNMRRLKMRMLVRIVAGCITACSLLLIWCFSEYRYLGICLASGMGVIAFSMVAATCKAHLRRNKSS